MRSPFAQASRILLHFDIAAVPSSCVVIDLYGTASDLRASFSRFHGQRSRAGCLPPRAIGKTDRLREFTAWQSAFVLSRHALWVPAVGGVRGQQRLMSGHDKAIAGHRKFCPAKKLFIPPHCEKWPWVRGERFPSSGRIPASIAKFGAEDENGPPHGGCVAEARSTLVCRNVKYRSTADIALYADSYQWAFR